MTDRPHVLVSCSFVSPWLDVELPPGWKVRPRPSDYEVGRVTVALRRLVEVLSVVRLARRHAALVVSTASAELLLLAALRPFLGRCLLVAYDPLQPSGERGQRVLRSLRRHIDLVMCIRRADLPAWEGAGDVVFVPFLAPAAPDSPLAAANEPVGVYAAGDAHRDYDLLVAAAAGTGLPVLICTRRPVATSAAPNIVVRGPVSPEEGRVHQTAAGITAVLLEETSLPAGPLVLLDAMAAGAAIVCTRSAGLVDYVEDGVEAIVLPHGATPLHTREALTRLAGDRDLRVRLGQAARQRIAGDLHPSQTVATCVGLIDRQVATRNPQRSQKG